MPRIRNTIGALTVAATAAVAATALAALPAIGATVDDVLGAVVRIDAGIPGDARTAEILGTQRAGSGVVIDSDGLILTIGYLILEAGDVTVSDAGGTTVPAEVVAYDYDTGFGLVRALAPLAATPLRLGDSEAMAVGTQVLAIGFGGTEGAVASRVISRHRFVGYWEYLLDQAIYVVPPHRRWAGAALVGADGRLYGIGSMSMADVTVDPRAIRGNMYVPINLLKPILGELLESGRAAGSDRPWLGMFTEERGPELTVAWVAPDGPASLAGIAEGDRVLEVAGARVTGMADLFGKVWALGRAGVEVPLTVLRGGEILQRVLHSADRYDYLRLQPSY